MKANWIDKQEDNWLKIIVAGMEGYKQEEWAEVAHRCKTLKHDCESVESYKCLLLEHQLDLLWELILPFADSVIMSKQMQHLAQLEAGKRMQEMKVAFVRSLAEFDVKRGSTVMKWLQRKWEVLDVNIGRRRQPQPIEVSPVIVTKDGEQISILDAQADKGDSPEETVEKKQIIEAIQGFWEKVSSGFPWQLAIAIWVDDSSCLEDPSDFPPHPPTARRCLIKELANGFPPKMAELDSVIMQTNVYFRRHIWKTLAESPHRAFE